MVNFHAQVISSIGVLVDSELLDLLEVIWNKGLTTTFSCQGSLGHSSEAYIAFSVSGELERDYIIRAFTQIVPEEAFGVYTLIPSKDGVGLVTLEALQPQHCVTVETYDLRPELVVIRFRPTLISLALQSFLASESWLHASTT